MNIKKYNKIHDELMNRLENGEITIETAKEVNDLAYEKYITESFLGSIAVTIGMMSAITIGGILLGMISEKIDAYKTVKLTGKDMSVYKTLLEKFAKEKQLIDPSETELVTLTVDKFKKLDNTDAIIDYIKSDKGCDTTLPDYPILDKSKDDFNTNSNIEKIIEYAESIVPTNDKALIYKNSIICFCGSQTIGKKNPVFKSPLFMNKISDAYVPLLHSYHTGVFYDINSIKFIMNYFKEEYPEEYATAVKINKTLKENRGKDSPKTRSQKSAEEWKKLRQELKNQKNKK